MSEANGTASPLTKATIVLDNSVAMTWLFRDETSTYGDAVHDALVDHVGCVAAIWPFEVANAAVIGQRRKRTTPDQVSAFLERIRKLRLLIDEIDPERVWTDVLHLARIYNLSAYDASYLELAIRRGAELASLDQPLLKAAEAAGVKRFESAG